MPQKSYLRRSHRLGGLGAQSQMKGFLRLFSHADILSPLLAGSVPHTAASHTTIRLSLARVGPLSAASDLPLSHEVMFEAAGQLGVFQRHDARKLLFVEYLVFSSRRSLLPRQTLFWKLL